VNTVCAFDDIFIDNCIAICIILQMTSRTHFARKEVDDVMGGEEGWKNVDQGEGELTELRFDT
jgi:hypothetical protein